MAIKFKCPDCGDERLECIFNGPHKCEITRIDKEGDFDYGEYESSSEPERFQCVTCGYALKDKDSLFIWENTKIAKWCEENCKQE